MRTISFHHPRSTAVAILAAATALTMTACGSTTSTLAATPASAITPITSVSVAASSHRGAAELKLDLGMRQLWEQHMEWTYSTIAAFAAGTNGVTPTLDRLLQNQVDIGDAIKPFYGDAAGDALTALLKAHINGVVTILTAATTGKTVAETQAIAAEYANAKAIGDFLAKANPTNWPKKTMEKMVETHITQTLVYATDQLQGKYADSISVYDSAEAHMDKMGDMLAMGIIAQFPDKFRK